MADRRSFVELRRKRAQVHRDAQTIVDTTDVIVRRLARANGTAAVPNRTDPRSRSRRGPSDPTLTSVTVADDYATTIRTQWHLTVRGHHTTVVHVCPPLDHPAALALTTPDSLAGLALRLCPDPPTIPPHTDDQTATKALAIAAVGGWDAAYNLRDPDPLHLGATATDLNRIRRRLEGLAADLLLWSNRTHPDAGRHPTPCVCRGEHACPCEADCDRIPSGRFCGRCRTHKHRAQRRQNTTR